MLAWASVGQPNDVGCLLLYLIIDVSKAWHWHESTTHLQWCCIRYKLIEVLLLKCWAYFTGAYLAKLTSIFSQSFKWIADRLKPICWWNVFRKYDFLVLGQVSPWISELQGSFQYYSKCYLLVAMCIYKKILSRWGETSSNFL